MSRFLLPLACRLPNFYNEEIWGEKKKKEMKEKFNFNFKIPSSVFVAVMVHYTEMQNCRSSPALSSCPSHWKLFRWVKAKKESPVLGCVPGQSMSPGDCTPPPCGSMGWFGGTVRSAQHWAMMWLPRGPLKVGGNPQLVLVLWSTLRLEQRAAFGCSLGAFTLTTSGDDEGWSRTESFGLC